MSANPKRERIDWHRVVFWSSLFTAMLYASLAMASRDGRVLTIFESRGRHVLLQMVRDLVSPQLAGHLGLNNATTAKTATATVAR